MDRTTVVIRTAPRTKLTAADHADVTFEVDEIDRRTRSGWSVLVRAVAEEVGPEHRADIVARTEATGVTPWAPGEHGRWLRLIPTSVTGRRIVPGELPPAVDPRAYLRAAATGAGRSGLRRRDTATPARQTTPPATASAGGTSSSSSHDSRTTSGGTR